MPSQVTGYLVPSGGRDALRWKSMCASISYEVLPHGFVGDAARSLSMAWLGCRPCTRRKGRRRDFSLKTGLAPKYVVLCHLVEQVLGHVKGHVQTGLRGGTYAKLQRTASARDVSPG